MPIVILEMWEDEIPQGFSQIAAARTCKEISNKTHELLHVPDPKDEEIRLVIKKKGVDFLTGDPGAWVRFEYTVGDDEYPGFDPSSFYPTEEEKRQVAEYTLELLRNYGIRTSAVWISSWEDTTFLMREKEPVTVSPPPSEAELGCLRNIFLDQNIRLVVSRERMLQSGASIMEGAAQPEEGPWGDVLSEMARTVAERLGIPENAIHTELVVADVAETDISIEYDGEMQEPEPMPESVHRYLAESIMQVLDENTLTSEGSAEVWVRPTNPERSIYR